MTIHQPKILRNIALAFTLAFLGLLIWSIVSSFNDHRGKENLMLYLFLILPSLLIGISYLLFNYIKVKDEHIIIWFLFTDLGTKVKIEKLLYLEKVQEPSILWRQPAFGMYTYRLVSKTHKYLIRTDEPEKICEVLNIPLKAS